MTVQPVRRLGDPVLRTPATEVVDFDRELRELVGDLWEVMESTGGAGLAAPQLGAGLRLFTYHCDGFAGHLVNPTVEVRGELVQDGPEGCLSIPGMTWECVRYRDVVARGWNMHGEPVEVAGTRLLARCVQHEVDHLDGVLFVDRLDHAERERASSEIVDADWFDGTVTEINGNPRSMFGGLQ